MNFDFRRAVGGGAIAQAKLGFTLAEVLVTLGIIGVVSAMTVPTLMQNYQRKSYVTQLHKVYNEVGQATQRYVTDNGYVSLKESRITENKTELNKFVKTYFKIVKDCGGSYSGCFADSYKHIDDNDETVFNTHECWSTVILASGAAVCFDTGAFESNAADKDINNDGVIDENDRIYNSGTQADAAMAVEVDINGKQGPNILGRDMFFMKVLPNGTVIDSENGASYLGKIMDAGWEMKY